jgi:hypothetical protein
MVYAKTEGRMGSATKEMTERPVMQAASPRRRFRLLDAMILVAATAAGCALSQPVSHALVGDLSWETLPEIWNPPYRSSLTDWDVLEERAILVACLTMPLVFVWTLALIPIRLVGPRPPFRRLTRQPGMMAACATMMAIAFIGLQFAAGLTVIGWDSTCELVLGYSSAFVPTLIGLAVSVSWMTLLVGRRWRAEPSWVDRLGRALGVFWILSAFAVIVLGLFLVISSLGSFGYPARNVNSPPAATVIAEPAEDPPDNTPR